MQVTLGNTALCAYFRSLLPNGGRLKDKPALDRSNLKCFSQIRYLLLSCRAFIRFTEFF